MEAAIDAGENDLTDVHLERQELTAGEIEQIRTVNSAGDAALRAVLLINGGAAVALLGFLAHLVAKDATSSIRTFSFALLYFGAGVFLTALAKCFKYNALYADGWFKFWNRACVVCATFGLAGFLGGLLHSFFAFANYSS